MRKHNQYEYNQCTTFSSEVAKLIEENESTTEFKKTNYIGKDRRKLLMTTVDTEEGSIKGNERL